MEESTVLREVKGKVLIVDDAPDTLEIIQRLLHYEGYDVTIASSGEEGVKKVEQEKPEVVLMDINLPGISGTEALRRIRTLNPIQCVIMLTAFATVDNQWHGSLEENTNAESYPMRHHADRLCNSG